MSIVNRHGVPAIGQEPCLSLKDYVWCLTRLCLCRARHKMFGASQDYVLAEHVIRCLVPHKTMSLQSTPYVCCPTRLCPCRVRHKLFAASQDHVLAEYAICLLPHKTMSLYTRMFYCHDVYTVACSVILQRLEMMYHLSYSSYWPMPFWWVLPFLAFLMPCHYILTGECVS